jgi:hypothetical protein
MNGNPSQTLTTPAPNTPGVHQMGKRRPPGPRRISARAKKGTKELETSTVVDVKPGLQDVRVTLG